MTTQRPPAAPMEDRPGIDWEHGAMPVLLDAIEDALPLSRYGVFVGEAGDHVEAPKCPIWFDGETVNIDINGRSPYNNVVLALVQAYAIALGLSRVGGIPKTSADVHAFEESLYAVYFEAKKHHIRIAESFRFLGMPDIRGWLRSEMERAKNPLPPTEVN